MNNTSSPTSLARVVSLHLHPVVAGALMQETEAIEVVEAKGILGEPRYFGRISQRTGEPSARQVSLIEREQIADHAAVLGLQRIAPGAVRANIETAGINLVSLVGRQIQIGQAVLALDSPRDPCAKMDAVCQGLRQLMEDHRQGVLARVIRSGTIRSGDPIQVLDP